MSSTLIAALILVAGNFSPFPLKSSFAEDLNADALNAIEQAADQICGTFLQRGTETKTEISGEAKAQLDGLIRKLVELGVEGAASFDTNEYVNVKRDELSSELRNMRECRLEIWRDLKDSISRRAEPEENTRIVEEWSGWKKGGYNRTAWCNDVRSRFEKAIGAAVSWRVLRTDERSKEEFYRQFYYKYYCEAEAKWRD